MYRPTSALLSGFVPLFLCLPVAADEPKGSDKSPKVVTEKDVVYGRVHGAGLLADVAYPASTDSLPAIISVHGGRWRGGHKLDGSTIKVEQWAGFGFFAMS